MKNSKHVPKIYGLLGLFTFSFGMIKGLFLSEELLEDYFMAFLWVILGLFMIQFSIMYVFYKDLKKDR